MASVFFWVTLVSAIGMIGFSYLDAGIAHGVCGHESVLLWARLTMPNGGGPSKISVRGDRGHALLNCLHVLHDAYRHGGIPPEIANKMKGAPFPGTWTRCTNLTRAYVAPGWDAYYFTFWLTSPASPPDSLCPDVE